MIRSMLYLFVFMFIFLGVVLHNSDVEDDTVRNIYNFSESSLSLWNSSNFEVKELNSTNITMQDAFVFRGKNMINKLVDFIGYSTVQVMKVSMELGYEKVYKYNPEAFVSLAKLIIILAIISIMIPVVVPVLALFYLLFEGFKWLIVSIRKRGKDGNK